MHETSLLKINVIITTDEKQEYFSNKVVYIVYRILLRMVIFPKIIQ
jgi:hypothetical protein